MIKRLFVLAAACLARALVVDPVVDTDRSVNTYSVETMARDLVAGAAADEQKLVRLYAFHRRMMHHFRTYAYTEDNYLTADAARAYNVYGGSWCTQQATYFGQLCGAVFGRRNTRGLHGKGALAGTGQPGPHSSFAVRFNEKDKWHWVDPIIGAWARNRTDHTIASLDEIARDPLILIDAVREKRASVPFFPCAIDKVPPCQYCYSNYDTAFVLDYCREYKGNSHTGQPAYTTMRKTLKKGEAYYWLWDFLPGGYFLLSDPEADSGKREWEWYPPRHFCGTDSLDAVNWPYFRPYRKTVKGKDCYRYYANGIHFYEPDLRREDPGDDTYLLNNMAFFADDRALPALRPKKPGVRSEIAWRIKLPYPLISMEISGEYVLKGPSASLSIAIAPLFFEIDSIEAGGSGDYPLAYLDTLNHEPFRTVHVFDPARKPRPFRLDLRDRIDPVYDRRASKAYGAGIRKRWITGTRGDSVTYKRVYQGYILKVSMKAGAPKNAGLNRLRVRCVFQHNMFALPQLEPGKNRVTVTAGPGSLKGENLKAGFGWMDRGRKRESVIPVRSAKTARILTVKQTEMPRMLYMWLGNTRAGRIIP